MLNSWGPLVLPAMSHHLWAGLWMAATVYAACAPYPIAAPVQNVTLPNEQTSRGIAIAVGSPEQHLAFEPRWPTNNAIVYNSDNGQCLTPSHSHNACETWRGGMYNLGLSKTAGMAKPETIAPESSDTLNIAQGYIADSIVLNENITLNSVAMGKPVQDGKGHEYSPRNILGLGDNSTVLRMLKESGKIVSRSWSFYNGWDGPDESTQRSGSFVLGGYDRAKVSGRRYRFPMGSYSTGCRTRLQIHVSDIVVNLANGTDVSLFPSGGKPMEACIVPHHPLLAFLPSDPYLARLNTFIETSTAPKHGLLPGSRPIAPDSPSFDGELTFKIWGGPSIRIPNHQLIQPDRIISDSTGALQRNGSVNVLPVEFTRDASLLPILGRLFLSSAYIMGNVDADEFILSEAKPSSDVDLVAVSEIGQELTDFCAPPDDQPDAKPAPEETPSPNDNSKDDSKEEGSGGLSTGAIAGIVVGVVGALILVGLCVFFLCRRRRKAPAYQAASDKDNLRDQPGLEVVSDHAGNPRQELYGDADTHVEHKKTELPATRETVEMEA